MTVYAQTWDELAKVIKNLTYTDGDTIRLERDDESNYAMLAVYITAPNSYRGEPGNRPLRHTRHEFLVPVATYNYENWRRWVYEQLRSIALHEVDEWFMDNGVRVYGPHHGNGEIPYVSWTGGTPEQVAKAPGED